MRIAGPNTAVRQLRFAPAKAIAARWVRSFCAAALSLAALCATPAFAEGEGGPIVGVRTDASAWRLIDGEGVVGVMGVGPFLNLGQVDPLTPEALLSGNQAGFSTPLASSPKPHYLVFKFDDTPTYRGGNDLRIDRKNNNNREQRIVNCSRFRIFCINPNYLS